MEKGKIHQKCPKTPGWPQVQGEVNLREKLWMCIIVEFSSKGKFIF